MYTLSLFNFHKESTEEGKKQREERATDAFPPYKLKILLRNNNIDIEITRTRNKSYRDGVGYPGNNYNIIRLRLIQLSAEEMNKDKRTEGTLVVYTAEPDEKGRNEGGAKIEREIFSLI